MFKVLKFSGEPRSGEGYKAVDYFGQIVYVNSNAAAITTNKLGAMYQWFVMPDVDEKTSCWHSSTWNASPKYLGLVYEFEGNWYDSLMWPVRFIDETELEVSLPAPNKQEVSLSETRFISNDKRLKALYAEGAVFHLDGHQVQFHIGKANNIESLRRFIDLLNKLGLPQSELIRVQSFSEETAGYTLSCVDDLLNCMQSSAEELGWETVAEKLGDVSDEAYGALQDSLCHWYDEHIGVKVKTEFTFELAVKEFKELCKL